MYKTDVCEMGYKITERKLLLEETELIKNWQE
jgi:hypothetical protein